MISLNHLTLKTFLNSPLTLEEENDDFVDVNTMVRNVMKEAVIVDEPQKEGYFPLIVKGGDWIQNI